MLVKMTITGVDAQRNRITGLAEFLTGTQAKQAAGNGLRKKIVSHLQGLGPNKRFPGATTGYYAQAAESATPPQATADGVEVGITQKGFRQRLLGGHIRQNTPGKTYLTIPGQALSYGRLAPEFGGLKFTFARNEEGYLMPALVATDNLVLSGLKTRRRRKKGDPYGPLPPRTPLEAGDVVYWLIRQVNQNPDPTVLPTVDEMKAAVLAELGDAVRAWLHDPTAELVLAS